MSDRPAMTIARALAQTSVYYKRSALLAGLVGLAAVSGALWVSQTWSKGGLIAIGLLFAVFCYRSLRASASYVDPAASPVLRAITQTPEQIARVWVERSGGPCFVIVETQRGARLPVRIEAHRVEADVPPLLDALAARFPEAEVSR